MIVELKIKVRDRRGDWRIKVSKIIHLGINPVSGGRPPKDISSRGIVMVKVGGILGERFLVGELRLEVKKDRNREREIII